MYPRKVKMGLWGKKTTSGKERGKQKSQGTEEWVGAAEEVTLRAGELQVHSLMSVLSPRTETLISGLLSACAQLRWLSSERKAPPKSYLCFPSQEEVVS